jgi:hypothetical protein
MNIYYTAKDIEEMAARGVHQLELGPGVTLTDFARETAQQFNIELVHGQKAGSAPSQPTTPEVVPAVPQSRYNKPQGCLRVNNSYSSPSSQIPTNQAANSPNSNTVNRLVDLMGKVIKRGG